MKNLFFALIFFIGNSLFSTAPLMHLPKIEEVKWLKEDGHLLIQSTLSNEPVLVEIYELDTQQMQLTPIEFEEIKADLLCKEVVLKREFDKEKAQILVLLRMREFIVSLYLLK